MGTSVLIDYQLKGWAAKNEHVIKQTYPDIRYVGNPPNPPQSSPDHMVAAYCMENGCDLLTADKTAYTTWLNHEMDEICISVFSTDGQIVYRLAACPRAAD